MKRILTVGLLTASILFTGCAQNGIGMNPGSSSVRQSFEIGTVVDSHKVLIDKGHLSSVATGAALGAGAGALLGSRSSGANAMKGGLIGAAVGAGAGLLASNMSGGNEVEAYEIEIEDRFKRIHRSYVEYDLPAGTMVEYIERPDGTISNIDVKRPGKRVN